MFAVLSILRDLRSLCFMNFRLFLLGGGLSALLIGPDVVRAQQNDALGKVRVRLLDSLAIPGDASDRSGLKGATSLLGVEANRFGGWGSGIARGDKPGSYWVVSDRGPSDGASQFQDRIHRIQLNWTGAKIEFQLEKTVLLKNLEGKNLLGDQTAIASQLRFDPEAIRVIESAKGPRIVLSDEYGPDIREFDENGNQTAAFEVPDYYKVKAPNAIPLLEVKNNKEGRIPNKGFEGMAFAGNRLVVAIQNSLIQDQNETIDGLAGPGTVARFLVLDTDSRKPLGEFLYALDEKEKDICEVLHWEKDRFIVLERDGLEGTEVKTKSKCLYVVDLSAAKMLPLAARLPDQTARKAALLPKTLLVDLTQLGLPVEKMARKWEGLAWGPTLPSGNRLLWLTIDNDFIKQKPSWIHALEIGNR